MINQYIEKIEENNIVSKTDTAGIITYVSDEFCKVFEFTRNELIGKNHNLVRHPDVAKSVYEKLWKTILNKKTYKGTVRNLTKSGKTIYLNTIVFPLLDNEDKILEFVAVRYNITDSIIANKKLVARDAQLALLNSSLEEKVENQTKQLLELNKHLERRIQEEVTKSQNREKIMYQQSKLASMGEMIGNIAHQWRQPLNNLNIILYKMKKEYNKNQINFNIAYEDVKEITKSMSNTIEDFSNFFKPDKKTELFLINDSIVQATSMLKKTLTDENINIEFEEESDYKILGYKNEFTHVIVNILNNARDMLKYKDGDKNISIMTNLLQDEKINNYISISIQDNAGGIDSDIIEKIFEPYFTTKHKSSGTGIGLYMCKQIIENSMNGLIEVENINGGACFRIKIQCLEECECLT